MDSNLISYLTEIDDTSNEHSVRRWQLRVRTYLKEAYGDIIANKFDSYDDINNAWDAQAQQESYLKVFVNNIEANKERMADSRFWSPNHLKLFISHLSNFSEKTEQLQRNLRQYGISAFVAHKSIEPTKEWQEEIEKALHSMDALAAILTPKFNQSSWTDQEIGVAIGKDVLIVPITKGMTPYGFIAKYQGMTGEGKTIGDVSLEIFSIISEHPKTKDKIATSLVNQILLTNSTEDAIKKLSLLNNIKSLPQGYFAKIRDGIKENPIVYNSTDFISLLNKVLGDHGLDHLVNTKIHDLTFDEDIPF